MMTFFFRKIFNINQEEIKAGDTIEVLTNTIEIQNYHLINGEKFFGRVPKIGDWHKVAQVSDDVIRIAFNGTYFALLRSQVKKVK